MNNTDHFLKRKLRDAELAPRPEAWDRIEAGLSKKNKGLTWMRAAAAIALLGMLTGALVWYRSSEDQKTVATRKVKEATPALKEEEQPITPAVKRNPQAMEYKATPRQADSVAADSVPAPAGNVNQVATLHQETGMEHPVLLETTVVVQAVVAVPVKKPLVIEFVLDAVPLKDEPAVASGKTEEKKNGWQRAFELAVEAKNSDHPLGGLRQAKDDLFALNFKKDKQKKQ